MLNNIVTLGEEKKSIYPQEYILTHWFDLLLSFRVFFYGAKRHKGFPPPLYQAVLKSTVSIGLLAHPLD